MIETPRLILRGWEPGDRAPMAAINRDPAVMRHLGTTLTAAETEDSMARMAATEHELGYCFWAVERREDRRLLGFCGLKPGPADTPLYGQTEIGWRLASDVWGRGYAREAAAASLAWAWAHGLTRVLAMTVDANVASWGLMVRLGMRRRPDLDFDHPSLPQASPLRRHIVYDKSSPLPPA